MNALRKPIKFLFSSQVNEKYGKQKEFISSKNETQYLI